MFSFFKKKKHYNENVKNLFLKICALLPNKYSFLYSQIKENIIYSFKRENNNYYRIICHKNILNKYDNIKNSCFKINNILLENKELNKKTNIAIIVGYNTISGFTLENEDFLDIDYQNVDVDISNIKIDISGDGDLKKLFTKEELEHINLNDVYEVELDGTVYYHIFDLEDGDFIGIDKEKNVYKITHDPYEIVLLKNKLIEIDKNNI